MKIIGNSINAAVLVLSVLFTLGTWTAQAFGRALERRLVFISFGAPPKTWREWLEVLLFYAVIVFLIKLNF
jgi:hypothetical protein